MSAHEIIRGSCGHLIAQCRCIGQGPGPKPVRTVPRKCYACSIFVSLNTPIGQPVQEPEVKDQHLPLDASVE